MRGQGSGGSPEQLALEEKEWLDESMHEEGPDAVHLEVHEDHHHDAHPVGTDQLLELLHVVGELGSSSCYILSAARARNFGLLCIR